MKKKTYFLSAFTILLALMVSGCGSPTTVEGETTETVTHYEETEQSVFTMPTFSDNTVLFENAAVRIAVNSDSISQKGSGQYEHYSIKMDVQNKTSDELQVSFPYLTVNGVYLDAYYTYAYGCTVSPGDHEKTSIDIYFSDLELAGIKEIGTIASDVRIADAGGNPMPEYDGRLECICSDAHAVIPKLGAVVYDKHGITVRMVRSEIRDGWFYSYYAVTNASDIDIGIGSEKMIINGESVEHLLAWTPVPAGVSAVDVVLANNNDLDENTFRFDDLKTWDAEIMFGVYTDSKAVPFDTFTVSCKSN